MLFGECENDPGKMIRMAVAREHIKRFFRRQSRERSLKIVEKEKRPLRLDKKCAVVDIGDLPTASLPVAYGLRIYYHTLPISCNYPIDFFLNMSIIIVQIPLCETRFHNMELLGIQTNESGPFRQAEKQLQNICKQRREGYEQSIRTDSENRYRSGRRTG